jgi:hypothetical protein
MGMAWITSRLSSSSSRTGELEEVAGTIGTEQQCPARLVVAILECEAGDRVQSGVDDVVVRDAVLASRAVQFHTARL